MWMVSASLHIPPQSPSHWSTNQVLGIRLVSHRLAREGRYCRSVPLSPAWWVISARAQKRRELDLSHIAGVAAGQTKCPVIPSAWVRFE